MKMDTKASRGGSDSSERQSQEVVPRASVGLAFGKGSRTWLRQSWQDLAGRRAERKLVERVVVFRRARQLVVRSKGLQTDPD